MRIKPQSQEVEDVPKITLPVHLRVDCQRENNSWIAVSGVSGMSEMTIPMVKTSDKRARLSDAETRRYDVRLCFVEPDSVKPGQRVFDVMIEGKPVVKDLDVVKSAGGTNRPLVRELKNLEVHGALDLSFSASKRKPLLCGVEVIAR